MLSVKKLRENQEAIIEQLKVRGDSYPQLVEKVIELDQNHRNKLQQLEENKARANELARNIGDYFKAGKKEEGEKLKQESNELKEKNKVLNEEVRTIVAELEKTLVEIPNPPHKSVHQGNDDTDNEVIASWEPEGGARKSAQPHWDIAEQYNLIDFEGGNKITGSGFPLFKGYGARLQRAMIQYFLDKAAKKGYTEYAPPHLVNENSAFATGQLPDKEGQMYFIEQENLYLIPTAEVPLTNYYRDTILSEDDLPAKLVGYTPCYRREAGSHGKDVRGLNRLHQFDKVEIVQIAHPEKSWEILEEMRNHTEEILQELGIPYRVVKLCSGDLGFASAFTYDLEAWSPGQNRWLEISSVSNFLDYQANRLKLRIKTGKKERFTAHTLNGSALALPRTIAALLENFADKDSIKIPEALQPYTGFKYIN